MRELKKLEKAINQLVEIRVKEEKWSDSMSKELIEVSSNFMAHVIFKHILEGGQQAAELLNELKSHNLYD